MEKRIEVVEMCVSDIKDGFGNPRKISKRKREELEQSLDSYGDFGLIVIDENDNIIAGNQRVSILKEKNPEQIVLCKKLIGYTKNELKAINIKDNTHAGEWDLDMLADWTADINLDLNIESNNEKTETRPIPEMELIHYEKYDYVMIVCRDELSYNSLTRALGIEDKKVLIGEKNGRKIKARAIWYDDMKAQIVPKE